MSLNKGEQLVRTFREIFPSGSVWYLYVEDLQRPALMDFREVGGGTPILLFPSREKADAWAKLTPDIRVTIRQVTADNLLAWLSGLSCTDSLCYQIDGPKFGELTIGQFLALLRSPNQLEN